MTTLFPVRKPCPRCGKPMKLVHDQTEEGRERYVCQDCDDPMRSSVARKWIRLSLQRSDRRPLGVREVATSTHASQHHSVLRSSGTSPNLRISLASPNSPVAGSPLRLKASAPT